MQKTLSVAAIEHGTVIDHVPAGQALRILQLLQLDARQLRATVGFNLASQTLGLKDLIKLENCVLTDNEAGEISVFAPHATINIIEHFVITRKLSTQLPELLSGIFACPNHNCITRTEAVKTCFHLSQPPQIKLTCHYCEKQFEREQMLARQGGL